MNSTQDSARSIAVAWTWNELDGDWRSGLRLELTGARHLAIRAADTPPVQHTNRSDATNEFGSTLHQILAGEVTRIHEMLARQRPESGDGAARTWTRNVLKAVVGEGELARSLLVTVSGMADAPYPHLTIDDDVFGLGDLPSQAEACRSLFTARVGAQLAEALAAIGQPIAEEVARVEVNGAVALRLRKLGRGNASLERNPEFIPRPSASDKMERLRDLVREWLRAHGAENDEPGDGRIPVPVAVREFELAAEALRRWHPDAALLVKGQPAPADGGGGRVPALRAICGMPPDC